MPATCVELNGLMAADKLALQPTSSSFRYYMKLCRLLQSRAAQSLLCFFLCNNIHFRLSVAFWLHQFIPLLFLFLLQNGPHPRRDLIKLFNAV